MNLGKSDLFAFIWWAFVLISFEFIDYEPYVKFSLSMIILVEISLYIFRYFKSRKKNNDSNEVK